MKDIETKLLCISSFLSKYNTYYVIGHKEPDGDCIGSQLALGSFLKSNGKNVILLSSGPFNRTEVLPFGKCFQNHLEESCPKEDAAIVVLDCSSLSRTGDIPGLKELNLPLAVIDHHASTLETDDVYFLDSTSPSVTLLVQKIIEAQRPLVFEEALMIMFGLCTDSGFFRHLDENSSDVFSSVSRIVATGVSPKKVFNMMNGGRPYDSRKMLAVYLNNTEKYYDGHLLITYISLEDQKRFGEASRDSDMMYQLLMTIENVEVVVALRQDTETDCTIGFRSKEKSISEIASIFGGGGHHLASGAKITASIPETKQKVIDSFRNFF